MTRRLELLALVAAACGGGGADRDAAPPGPDAGPRQPRLGYVDVVELRRLYPGGDPSEFRAGAVNARFWSAPPPSFHHQTMASGACQLLEYTPSMCDGFCEYVCLDGECVAFPLGVSAGRLDVDGLTTEVSMVPEDGWYYTEPLPAELFADDAHVVATLAGAVVPAMTLEADGVRPLDADIASAGITLDPGEDHAITWTPAGGGRVHVTINANNQGHGLPYLAIIECEDDDAAGQITIPAALIDAFPETYAWQACAGNDCPQSTIRRYRRAAQPVGDNEVELTVASQVSFGVEHHP